MTKHLVIVLGVIVLSAVPVLANKTSDPEKMNLVYTFSLQETDRIEISYARYEGTPRPLVVISDPVEIKDIIQAMDRDVYKTLTDTLCLYRIKFFQGKKLIVDWEYTYDLTFNSFLFRGKESDYLARDSKLAKLLDDETQKLKN